MLRLLTVLLWLPIGTQATTLPFENKETRLELSEILARMDSTESILLFYDKEVHFATPHKEIAYSYNAEKVSFLMASLAKEHEAYLENPFQSVNEQVEHLLFELFIELLGPIQEELTLDLKICPNKTLKSVPWNILRKEGKYLFDDHSITIDLKLALDPRSKRKHREKTSVCIIAPQFSHDKYIANDLEAMAIKSYFKTYSESWEACDVLHITSHGDTTGILVEDAEVRLRVRNILASKAVPQFVFLNTCHSSPLAEAFVYKGSNAAIGTLWEVDDRFAQMLSNQFYANLDIEYKANDALRESIMVLRRDGVNPEYAHPFQWGSYQIYGNNVQVYDKEGIELKQIFSRLLSLLTPLSIFFYYFGARLRGRLIEFNLI